MEIIIIIKPTSGRSSIVTHSTCAWTSLKVNNLSLLHHPRCTKGISSALSPFFFMWSFTAVNNWYFKCFFNNNDDDDGYDYSTPLLVLPLCTYILSWKLLLNYYYNILFFPATPSGWAYPRILLLITTLL